MNINTILKRYSTLKFDLKSYMPLSIFYMYDSIMYKEYLIKKKYKLKIKGYKTLFKNKIVLKNRVGNILINLLNNSVNITEILEKYREAIAEFKSEYDSKLFEFYKKEVEDMYAEVYEKISDESRNKFARRLVDEHPDTQDRDFYYSVVYPIFSVLSYDLLQISPYTIILIKSMDKFLYDYTNFDTFPMKQDYLNSLDFVIFLVLNDLWTIISEIEKIYTRPSTNKKGYVKYNNTLIKMPECEISFKDSRKNSRPYLYKYTTNYYLNLFSASVYSLSLSKYKLYKCDICGKYFINSKSKKICSKLCLEKYNKLKIEKNHNYRGKLRTEKAKHLYKLITDFLNRGVKNKNVQAKRDKMYEDFCNRYFKKIIALDKKYNFNPDSKLYQRDIVIWLENEYNKVKRAFHSKKIGNKNREKKKSSYYI